MNWKPTRRSNPTTSSTCTSRKVRYTRVSQTRHYVRQRQLADGGWNIYFGGPSEVNATVKAYFALGWPATPAERHTWFAPADAFAQLGGLERTNSFTRLYLALPVVIGWDMVPAVPPELMFLPPWSPHQHLRDVVVDSRHRHSADDSLCAQAVLARARRYPRLTNCLRIHLRKTLGFRSRAGHQLAELLSCSRPRS